ncbi:MAG TPA: MdtA/MuxA family multidrug efflux RND transporter periplasmic adaptor subunit [Steroidobacteraceae bacterium]|nr:MdtA/MuxA family multidrug efflux RND transporter periplasmic adaptor subunit [Steroidobacteraceae bacterium]
MTETEAAGSTGASAPRTFLQRHRLALLVIAILGVIVFLVYRHHQHQAALQAFAPGHGRGGRGGPNGPVAVSVATVTAGSIDMRIPALGTVTPLATVTVRTQISGQLQKIAFQEGQLVHAGDFLAQIDPRPYEAALAQARGNLRRDQALLADARLDLKRFEELITEDSIAQQQLDTQRALVDQDSGVVESDQALVNSAQVNLQYTHIVSPVTGRVGLRQVDQGNYVTPGDANGIVVVTQLQPITAIFSVPEDNVTLLMQRLRSGATLTVEAFDGGNSTRLAEGKVLSVDNEIDATTGTIKLRALFDNQDGLLFANQFVNIQLLVNVLENQTIIPGSAVHRGAPNGVISTFVYLVNNDSTVSVRPVTLGVTDAERVAITKGLKPGDVVVTEGGDRLRDGAPVLLPANTPQHPRQPAGAQQHPRQPGGSTGGHRSRPHAQQAP